MKSIHKLCLGLLALFLTVEIVAMQPQQENPVEKLYENAWEEDLDNLSKDDNWDDNGFLTQQWKDSAVEHAIELLEDNENTIKGLADQLHDRLTELYDVKNPRTGKKMIASTFNNTLQVVDDFVVVSDFRNALKEKITPELSGQLNDAKQQRQQQRKLKRQEQRKQKIQQEYEQLQGMQAVQRQEKEAEISGYGIQEKSANELQRANEYLQQQKQEQQKKLQQDRFTQQRARQQKKEHEEMKQTRKTIKQKVATQPVQQKERRLSLIERFWRWLGYSSEQKEQRRREREQRE
jgi:hypothetical protein